MDKEINKMKILLVHNYYKHSGGEDTVVFNEKKMFEQNGHEVILYSRDNSEIEGFNCIQKLCLPITSIFSIRTYKEINKIMKKEKIGIVHVHNTLALISPSVFYAAFANKIPVIQTLHNFRMLCPNGVFYINNHICEDCVTKGLSCSVKNKCYRDSRVQSIISAVILIVHRFLGTYKKVNFICLSNFNRDKIISLMKNGKQLVKEDKVFVKPNFVDIKSKIIPYKERQNQYVFVGRLEKIKGIDLLLTMWKELERKEKKCPELVICGTGSLENWCREFVEQNNLKQIKLLGFVEQDEVLDIMSISQATLMPSQWYEGFPMTIIESLACGTPVIGSDIGNVGNILREQNPKMVINKWDYENMKKKMIELNIENIKIDNVKFSSANNYIIINEIFNKLLQKPEKQL